MQPKPRPFFLSFESTLQDKLPRWVLTQAMEESMWEYDSMHLWDPAGRSKKPGSLIRIGSICLSFFRLMTKSGYLPAEASAEINQACQSFEGPLEPSPRPEDCSVAGYFLAKNAAELCEAAFCSRCIQKDTDCPSLKALRARSASKKQAAVHGRMNMKEAVATSQYRLMPTKPYQAQPRPPVAVPKMRGAELKALCP